MWEHRSVSNKAYIETKQMRPSETYVRLMDIVEEAVSKAQVDEFDHNEFLKYVPRRGPWEELPQSDTTKADPRVR